MRESLLLDYVLLLRQCMLEEAKVALWGECRLLSGC